MLIAERSGQMALVRGVAIASKPIGVAIPIFFISGGLLGLLTAINVGYNLLAPWLVRRRGSGSCDSHGST